jgi:biopolymer transport protein ExbB/TolQ
MESVYQDEAEVSEVQLTPQDQLRLQWQQQPGAIPLLRQKNVIDQNAELLPYAAVAGLRGWISPGMFALQGLVLIAFIAAGLNWLTTRHSGNLEDEITALHASAQSEIKRQEEIISATQAEIRRISSSASSSFKLHMSALPLSREQALTALNNSLEESRSSEEQYKKDMAARERHLRARQSTMAIVNSASPLIFSLALFLAAGLFSQGAQKEFPRNRHARNLADYYLYFVTAEGLWPNLVLLAFLFVALSGSDYGLSGLFSSVGPLFWVVFWIGFYGLLLHFFVMTARGLYRAMQARPPATEWSFDNRLLIGVHNSFFIVFAGLEAVFLGLCYAFYFLQR